MDLGTPLSPPPLAVPPDDFYAQGQSVEPAWATRGLEEGGWGCPWKPGGGRAPESQTPHVTSAIAVCLMSFSVWIPQGFDCQDGTYTAHTLAHTQVYKAKFQDQLDQLEETGESP